MSYQIPAVEPRSVTAGDTAQWQRLLSDYPVADWTLNYYLVGPNSFSITTTSNGSYHEAVVNATTTNTWNTGNYYIYARVSDGTNTYPVATQFTTLEVKQNPAYVGNTTTDQRSWEYQALEDVEAAILSLASKTLSTATVNGTSYTFQDLDKLYALRNRLRAEIATLESGGGKLIYTQFTRPI